MQPVFSEAHVTHHINVPYIKVNELPSRIMSEAELIDNHVAIDTAIGDGIVSERELSSVEATRVREDDRFERLPLALRANLQARVENKAFDGHIRQPSLAREAFASSVRPGAIVDSTMREHAKLLVSLANSVDSSINLSQIEDLRASFADGTLGKVLLERQDTRALVQKGRITQKRIWAALEPSLNALESFMLSGAGDLCALRKVTIAGIEFEKGFRLEIHSREKLGLPAEASDRQMLESSIASYETYFKGMGQDRIYILSREGDLFVVPNAHGKISENIKPGSTAMVYNGGEVKSGAEVIAFRDIRNSVHEATIGYVGSKVKPFVDKLTERSEEGMQELALHRVHNEGAQPFFDKHGNFKGFHSLEPSYDTVVGGTVEEIFDETFIDMEGLYNVKNVAKGAGAIVGNVSREGLVAAMRDAVNWVSNTTLVGTFATNITLAAAYGGVSLFGATVNLVEHAYRKTQMSESRFYQASGITLNRDV